MTDHLIEDHGVTPRKLRELWENRSGSVSWDDFLEVNHDLLHTLAAGRAVSNTGGED